MKKQSLFFLSVLVALYGSLGSAVGQDVEIQVPKTDATTGFSVTNADNDTIFTVRGDGNVGIGTTTPRVKLDVAGRLRWSEVLSENSASTESGSEVSVIRFLTDGGNPSWSLMKRGEAHASQPGWLYLYHYDGTTFRSALVGKPDGTAALGMNGNVGIGTTRPVRKLQISGGSILLDNSQPILMKDTDGTARTMVHFSTANNLQIGGATGTIGGSVQIAADGRIRFYPGSGSGWNETVTFGTNGNVGIGTTSPEQELDVRGQIIIQSTSGLNTDGLLFKRPGSVSASNTMFSFSERSTDTDLWLYGYDGTTFRNFIGFDYPNFKVSIGPSGTGANTLVADLANGNVGIGTTSPDNILTVVQNSSTDPIADAWTTYSSRRWKTNIEPIEGALDKVQHLRGVSFDWKADGKHDIGLIAEEVGEVIPEVVAYEANGIDAKSVDYARLVAVLIEGMKEQQEEIEDLKVAVTAMESQYELALKE
ncbi:MAG: tail fiber domain-containing protein [Candidatus Neomarinimicrobiota bacterium]